MAVKPIPDGYHTVTPYLVVEKAAQLIEFLKKAFDATVIEVMASPDGTVRHAEVRIGDSNVMLEPQARPPASGDRPRAGWRIRSRTLSCACRLPSSPKRLR